MKNVLVPVYAHQDWQNVLKYATSVIQRSGANLTFLVASRRGLVSGIDHMIWRQTNDTTELAQAFKHNRIPKRLAALLKNEALVQGNLKISLHKGGLMQAILNETAQHDYDLVLSGTPGGSLIRRIFNPISLTQLINDAKAPVFIVPATGRFNEIQHITYAVDLTSYDPLVIRQVKEIASLFDAKLTIAHVNPEATMAQRETYVNSLERTISDTLDYPKIYYKFFDHADPFRGIKKFVDHSNSQMLAMINRSPLSWREIFSAKSMTMRMTRQSRIPILAFRKKDV